jgi:hypothetical protein
MRYPLHLAAAEARILVVSFLLGISADPNCMDRWGGTPLDDALRGGTPYHLYCAKLIHGWGGRLGPGLAGTPEGEELTRKMETIDIGNVRNLIKRLMAKVEPWNHARPSRCLRAYLMITTFWLRFPIISHRFQFADLSSV